MFRQLVPWDSNQLWHEWRFSGFQHWGGEQLNGNEDEYFWVPGAQDKTAFDLACLSDKYDVTKTDKKNFSDDGQMANVSGYIHAVSKEDRSDHFDIEMDLVSFLTDPNALHLMIRCPQNRKDVVQKCINENYKFLGQYPDEYPTTYKQRTLTKPTPFSEKYIED